jgi:hypothetical protein
MSHKPTRDYRVQGTLEFVLIKSGLLGIREDGGQQRIVGTPELEKLFDNSMPAMEMIEPMLMKLVQAEANLRSGFLSDSPLRAEAIRGLGEQGLKSERLGELHGCLLKGIERATEEIQRARQCTY